MKTQNPWMGRARGSAGNMTSSKVYDKNVMRAKAFEVNNPKTAAQTKERNFFSRCQNIASTVSEELLRSLFPSKPKSKSRRNMLLSQLLEMKNDYGTPNYYFDTNKFALGNGQKIKQAAYSITDGICSIPAQEISDFGSNAEISSSVALIILDDSNNRIICNYTDYTIEDFQFNGQIDLVSEYGEFDGSIYLTIAETGESLAEKQLGTFKLKTRAI